MNKVRTRNNRRISLNGFKKSCDIQPYVQAQEPELSAFQNSLMLMQILRKHENLIFVNKQKEVDISLDHFYQHNEVLQRIKNDRKKKRQSKVLLSSFRVLEDLDLNRKYAYSKLEQENKQIADRIFALETALDKMSCSKKSQALCPEYLDKLQAKVKSRRKVEGKLTKMLDEINDERDEIIDRAKAEAISLVKSKIGNKGNKKQLEGANIQILQAIFAKLDQ